MAHIPDIWNALAEELAQIVYAAWPEVNGDTHPIYRATQSQRNPWRADFEARDIESPWIVWSADQTSKVSGWGACNVVYQPIITVWYITENAGQDDIAQYVQDKLSDLENILVTTYPSAFQVMQDLMEHDISAENDANRVFLPNNQAFFGGCLRFRVCIGYRYPLPAAGED